MSDRFDCVVIGAGVVGLAIGRALALLGREVLVIERHRAPAQETSSRNSGVIHSGIYYPFGSLKARFCVRGREMLYEYCASRDIAYQRCGKIIVAQAEQLRALEQLEARGRQNGVTDLQRLTAADVQTLEPRVACVAGLLSPATGIVDVHELVMALVADLESRGGSVAYGSTLESIDVTGQSPVLRVRSGPDRMDFACDVLVNSAGLDAVPLLRAIDGYPAALVRTAYYAKGNYFSLRGGRPFRHLVYPMPNEAGLGIHATLDLDGATRFGPNVEWVDAPEYAVDERHAAEFYTSIRGYWPGLPDGSLQPGYAGVRPKLVGPQEAAADFVIEGPLDHGRSGLFNLLGIESPGLTSSLAIAEYVASMI
jgi:L-2-hydroxyglutarate oxidase LhgO